MQHIAIVGSRNYPNLAQVRAFVRSLPAGSIVVSGGAPGVDQAAVSEARACGLQVLVIPAEWGKHGRAAGPIRNRAIVAASNRVVAFHHQGSPGTASTIALARSAAVPVTVYTSQPEPLGLFTKL